MKRKLLTLLCVLGSALLLLTSAMCYYRPYKPIFMERSELEKSVFYQSEPKELERPGKIYFKYPYLFINEKYRGIHVINNSNPTNPRKEGFIVAPGCIDIAMKGDIIYLDNGVDLVAFNFNTKEVTERLKNIFPEPASPDGGYYYMSTRPDGFILVGWERNRY